VKTGTLTVRQMKETRDIIAAQEADAVIGAPVALLVSQGLPAPPKCLRQRSTATRAELIGEHTQPRGAGVS
jgi:hypothetical protein